MPVHDRRLMILDRGKSVESAVVEMGLGTNLWGSREHCVVAARAVKRWQVSV